jgi:hypothetical protein
MRYMRAAAESLHTPHGYIGDVLEPMQPGARKEGAP